MTSVDVYIWWCVADARIGRYKVISGSCGLPVLAILSLSSFSTIDRRLFKCLQTHDGYYMVSSLLDLEDNSKQITVSFNLEWNNFKVLQQLKSHPS